MPDGEDPYQARYSYALLHTVYCIRLLGRQPASDYPRGLLFHPEWVEAMDSVLHCSLSISCVPADRARALRTKPTQSLGTVAQKFCKWFFFTGLVGVCGVVTLIFCSLFLNGVGVVPNSVQGQGLEGLVGANNILLTE